MARVRMTVDRVMRRLMVTSPFSVLGLFKSTSSSPTSSPLRIQSATLSPRSIIWPEKHSRHWLIVSTQRAPITAGACARGAQHLCVLPQRGAPTTRRAHSRGARADLQGETEAEDHGADDGALSRAVWPDHQIQCGPREHCAIFVSHKVFHPGHRACARALISVVPRHGAQLSDAETAAAAAVTARAAVRKQHT